MNKPMLSFVIPCYRSEHTIGAVVQELTDTLSTRPEYEYEIVLVNDGSPDNTAGALEALGRGLPSLVISLCRYVVVMIPLAFVLSRFLGASGVWHAFWLTEAVTAAISWGIYRRTFRGEGRSAAQ